MRPRLLLPSLLVASLFTGCVTPTGPVGGPSARPILRPKPPAASDAPAPVLTHGGNIVGNNGGNIISDNGASLIGKVKAPAGIVSNNGGGIISDNGASLIGNNGANFRVLARADERPVAGAVVHVRDAEGRAVVGADGKPLTAVTDAQGAYAFKGFQPANNLVLVVELGAKGALRAIAPRLAAKDVPIDLDLTSTLSTGYILDQYVDSQPERQRTLDKLPADVEAETRRKVGVAFENGTTAVPEALTDEAVVATVDALRRADPAVDQQLEVVKQLLVAAGLSDLGSGRSAKAMFFGAIGALWLSPAGTLHVTSQFHRRIWKVDAEQRVQVVAGTGVAGGASLTGKAGPEGPLASLRSTQVAADGRVWIAEYPLGDEVDGATPNGRISRLEKDGRLTEISRAFSGLAIAVPTGPDEALVLDTKNFLSGSPTAPIEAALHSLKADGTTRLIGHYPAAIAKQVALATEFAPASGGGVLTVLREGTTRTLSRLEPTSTAITPVYTVPATVSSVALDMAGNLFMLTVTPSRKLEVRRTDGTVVTLGENVPGTRGVAAGALAADGSAWVAIGSLVYQVRDGQFLHQAGSATIAPGVEARDYILANPTGLAVSAAGIFLGDDEQGTVVKIGSDQRVYPFAGTGEAGDYGRSTSPDGDGGPATAARLVTPTLMHADAAGQIYLREPQRIRRVGTDGAISSPFQVPAASQKEIVDFAVAPDGTLFVAVLDYSDDSFLLQKLAPGATQPQRVHDLGINTSVVLAVGPDGTPYATMLDEDEEASLLVRWTSSGMQTLTRHDRLYPDVLEPGNLAIDAQGRAYVIDREGGGTVQRFDPATSKWTVVAGAGGRHFNGTTIDTSLDDPHFPRFGPQGDLYLIDTGHQQVKRVPAGEL